MLLLPLGADIIVMGDFNADLGHLGGPMSCMSTGKSFVYSSLNYGASHLQTNFSSYTYESDAHSTQSTIDHILCPLGILP